MINQPPIINIFEKAAIKASKYLKRDFGEIENLQIQSKKISDFVTNADLKSEKILLETLQYYYPNATYITEETGIIKGNEETIVIDPIDGTTNFIHGIPFVSIVIGRIINGEITDGIILNPILNEFYWASKGKGAWCNNKRLRVSKRHQMINCLIGTGIPYADNAHENYLDEIDIVSKTTCGLRRIGTASLDLAFVASGKLDGFWERNLNIWDICSGVILVKEAGGKINDMDYSSAKVIKVLAGSNSIYEKMIENLNNF